MLTEIFKAAESFATRMGKMPLALLRSEYSLVSRKEAFNPFPSKPWFLRVCSIRLLKTLWEKEKLLVTSNFSFSHNVFYPFGELSLILVKIEIVVGKLNLEEL